MLQRHAALINTNVLQLAGPNPISRRHHLLALTIFAAVIVTVFYRAIFFGEVLASVDMLSKELPWRAVLPAQVQVSNFTCADVFTVFHPWKHFVHDELQAGRFPLWCTHVGCGYPLAGEGVIKLFGLTTLFLWFTPPRIAAILTFSSQLFIAMAGMYVLLQALRLRWGAAVFGALTYGLNSVMFQYLEFEHMTGGLMMLPWMCWALWRGAADEAQPARWWALAGALWGGSILNGSVQSGAIVWTSAATFVLTALWQKKRECWIRESLWAVGLFSVLGLTVSAIALWPNLELFALNTRSRFDRVDWIAMVWKRPVALVPYVASMLNPDSVGNYQTYDIVRGLGAVGTTATTPSMSDLRVYTGLIAVMLAVIGLRVRGDAKALGIAMVMGPVFVAVVTPLCLILYFRVLSAGACGVAMLAALGWERYCGDDNQLGGDTRRIVRGLIVSIILTLGLGAAVSAKRTVLTGKVEALGAKGTSFYKVDVDGQHQRAAETVRNFGLTGHAVLRFSVLAAAAAALCVCVRPRLMAASLLAVVNTGDLVEFAGRTLPSAPAQFEYPSTPAMEFLRQQPGMFRVASAWNMDTEWPTARANLLMLAGLDDPRVWESLVPANPLLEAQDWSALNVKYFVVPPGRTPPSANWKPVWRGEVDIYENPDVEPRIYFTTEPKSGRSEGGVIQTSAYHSGAVKVQMEAPSAGWLVVGEHNYPGWEARVNGRSEPVTLARGQWLAVPVKKGNSEVALDYRPASVRWGAYVSGSGLIVVLGLWRWKSS